MSNIPLGPMMSLGFLLASCHGPVKVQKQADVGSSRLEMFRKHREAMKRRRSA